MTHAAKSSKRHSVKSTSLRGNWTNQRTSESDLAAGSPRLPTTTAKTMNSEQLMRRNTFLFYVIVAGAFLTASAFLSITISRNLGMAAESLEQSHTLTQRINRLELLFDMIPGGVLIICEDGIVMDCNGGFCDMGMYKSREVIGHHFTKFMPEEFREDHLKRWANPEMAAEFGAETYCLPEGQLLRSDGTTMEKRILIQRTRINSRFEWMVFFDPTT